LSKIIFAFCEKKLACFIETCFIRFAGLSGAGKSKLAFPVLEKEAKPMFVRTKTAATTVVAKRNFRLARERFERGREFGMTGVTLHCYVLGLQNKEGVESARALIAFSLLTSGIGTYNIADVAAVTGLTEAAVRTALTAYLVPRAFECQPFFPFAFAYNKRDAQVSVVAAQGAKDAATALLAPKERKARKAIEAPSLPALPAPDAA
jgi:hypothetical protein